MSLNFNKTCPVSEEHGDKKIPLVGIEPSGDGIRYVFACGHGQIIQVVGTGAEKLKQISDQLGNLKDKSIDELYEEMGGLDPSLSSEDLKNTLVKKKKGESIFDKNTPAIKKTICEDLKFCKYVKYYKEIPVPTGFVVAYNLFTSSGLELAMITYLVSLFMRLGIDKLKKWCECDR